MRIPPLLRRPGKMILCAVLLAVTSGAALLFALQAWLDGIALEHSMDAYAYVGTVTYEAPFTENSTITEDLQTSMDLAVLDEEIVTLIQNSEYVTSFDTRSTLAGLVEGIYTVPDRMITTARLNQHYFIEATVLSMFDSTEFSGLCYDFYTLRLEKQWGGDMLMQGALNLFLYRSAEEDPLTPGSRVFLVGCYSADGNGVRTDYTMTYTRDAVAISGERYANSILMNNAVAIIPEGVDSESWIMAYMEENGLLPLYESYCSLEKAVTVRQVSDLVMHPYFSSGRIFMESGRAIEPSDEGKKVCVISQGLSIRNRLNVGDTIRLAVADGCYTTSGLSSSANGWESGFPMTCTVLLVKSFETEIFLRIMWGEKRIGVFYSLIGVVILWLIVSTAISMAVVGLAAGGDWFLWAAGYAGTVSASCVIAAAIPMGRACARNLVTFYQSKEGE